MKAVPRKGPRVPAPPDDAVDLRRRLAQAEEALRAIRSGEVDAVVVAGRLGPQVFTLEGAEHAYRVLIENMNEGALALTTDRTILYANECFARMVKRPLEQVTGASFRRFLSPEDLAVLRRLMKGRDKSGSKIQATLKADDGSLVPAQISIRPLAKSGLDAAAIGMVVTDLTEARRNEETLRALTHRLVQVQEAERGRLALELHDHITQLLCVVLIRSDALAAGLSGSDGPTRKAKKAAMKLREMLGRTAQEVESISRGLRPGVLGQLGLAAVLRGAGAEFAERTGVSVESACAEPTERLPADAELTLYRVLQEAFTNVERHARARHVVVRLAQPGRLVQLSIADDGSGFDTDHRSVRRSAARDLGLLVMRERVAMVGGRFSIESSPGRGTTVRADIPLEEVARG
jgi:two-component system NarL family sensor kinase